MDILRFLKKSKHKWFQNIIIPIAKNSGLQATLWNSLFS